VIKTLLCAGLRTVYQSVLGGPRLISAYCVTLCDEKQLSDIRTHVLLTLSVFASTYHCSTPFSLRNNVKSRTTARVIDKTLGMQIIIAEHKPGTERLRQSQCHISSAMTDLAKENSCVMCVSVLKSRRIIPILINYHGDYSLL
jgi:hypothetical protein